MLLDFFGANITDGYVENNSQYAEMYKAVVRKNIMNGNGYISLDRILYFYLENDNLTFDQIYTDNLDIDLKPYQKYVKWIDIKYIQYVIVMKLKILVK